MAKKNLYEQWASPKWKNLWQDLPANEPDFKTLFSSPKPAVLKVSRDPMSMRLKVFS